MAAARLNHRLPYPAGGRYHRSSISRSFIYLFTCPPRRPLLEVTRLRGRWRGPCREAKWAVAGQEAVAAGRGPGRSDAVPVAVTWVPPRWRLPREASDNRPRPLSPSLPPPPCPPPCPPGLRRPPHSPQVRDGAAATAERWAAGFLRAWLGKGTPCPAVAGGDPLGLHPGACSGRGLSGHRALRPSHSALGGGRWGRAALPGGRAGQGCEAPQRSPPEAPLPRLVPPRLDRGDGPQQGRPRSRAALSFGGGPWAGVERRYAAPRSGRFPVAAPGGMAAGLGRVPRVFVGFSGAASGREGSVVWYKKLSCPVCLVFPGKLSFLRGVKRVSC